MTDHRNQQQIRNPICTLLFHVTLIHHQPWNESSQRLQDLLKFYKVKTREIPNPDSHHVPLKKAKSQGDVHWASLSPSHWPWSWKEMHSFTDICPWAGDSDHHLVSLPITTKAGCCRSTASFSTMAVSTWGISCSSALARQVACSSQEGANISPIGSINFTPLSS